MSEPLSAKVSLALDADARHQYSLPGGGSRSMLLVFDGQKVRAIATSESGDFVPGSTHAAVSLDFWDDAAKAIVTSGATFDVWYGDTIGRGRGAVGVVAPPGVSAVTPVALLSRGALRKGVE